MQGVYLFKITETWFVKYVQKPMYKIWSTIKAQERPGWCCSGVFINNFGGVSIENSVEHLRWTFFVIQWTKAKIVNWVLNTPLKLGTDFTFITWLWFGWVDILPVLWIHLLKYFKNLFWKKKIQTIWCLRLRGHILEF